MKLTGFATRSLGVCTLAAISLGASSYLSGSARTPAVPPAPVLFSPQDAYNAAELFPKLDARHRWQKDHLGRVSGVRTYKVVNDKNKVVAEEVVTEEYRAPNIENLTSTSQQGSQFVLHRVFQRLMQREKQRVQNDKDPDSLITPENYTLEELGNDKVGGAACLLFRAVPRRKATDLFEGKIWIDIQDFAIVKMAGQLAKNPSFWIKRVDFVREYQNIQGFWLLSRETAVSTIRIFGKETLTIDYQYNAVVSSN